MVAIFVFEAFNTCLCEVYVNFSMRLMDARSDKRILQCVSRKCFKCVSLCVPVLGRRRIVMFKIGLRVQLKFNIAI